MLSFFVFYHISFRYFRFYFFLKQTKNYLLQSFNNNNKKTHNGAKIRKKINNCKKYIHKKKSLTLGKNYYVENNSNIDKFIKQIKIRKKEKFTRKHTLTHSITTTQDDIEITLNLLIF